MRTVFGICFIASLLVPGIAERHACGQLPVNPRLVRVTVDPETGNDIIYWQPGPYADVDHYVIGVVYPLYPGDLQPVATAPAGAVSAVLSNTESNSHPVGYSVFAVQQGTGDYYLYEEPDSTIHLTAVFDSCRSSITLSWNDYNKWRGEIQQYTVYRRMGNGIYMVLATLTENLSSSNTWTLFPVEANTDYQLFVEVMANHGGSVLQSTSNRVDRFTEMSVVPDFISAGYATFGENGGIDLSFTIDPASELQVYKLLRSSAPGTSGDTIATFTTVEKAVRYTDDISFTSGIYYYRLVAFNNCGQETVTSNYACNVLLDGRSDQMQVRLDWNDYLEWPGGVDHYTVYRSAGEDGPAENIHEGKDTFFSDDISGLSGYNNSRSTRVCYQVVAFESAGPDAVQNLSRSNYLCVTLEPDVRMPNAFIPNSHDGVNDTFYPIFSLVPERYILTIYNRAGLKIWEGSGPWDGTVNGKPVPEEVYMYRLRVYNYEGPGSEHTGQVTVVYR